MSEATLQPFPPGWVRTPLGSLVEPRTGKADPQATPDARFIGMEQIEPHTMRLLGTVPCATMKSGANTFQPFDVLYGRMRAYLNKVYQPDFSGLCSGEFIVLPETGAVLGRFLKYRLNSGDFVRFANHLNTGDRPRVDFDQISVFNVLLPPKPEQERIADALDELLSDLDAGVAALERVQAKLKHYRAAVLKAAVEGALTAEWRAQHPATEPAITLLTRILAERRRRWEEAQLKKFKEAGKVPPKDWKAKYQEPAPPITEGLPTLPDGWSWVTIEQCSDLIQYGTSAKTGPNTDGIPVLRMGNIRTDGTLDITDLKYLPAAHDEFPALLLANGDLLFNRTNSAELVGKTGHYRGVPTPCSFASYLIRVKMLNGASPAIVSFAINGVGGKRWIKTVVSQMVGQANVNGSKLAAFVFPLAPEVEQTAIVDATEVQLSVIEHLEADIESKLKSSQALRQSILRHAFTGQLVPQDEKDEPASELLKRIAAQHEEIARQAQAAKKTVPKASPKRAAKKTKVKQSHD